MSVQVEVEIRQSCPHGLTEEDLHWLFGEKHTESFKRFCKWMNGQTVMLCGGCSYDYDRGSYFTDECAMSIADHTPLPPGMRMANTGRPVTYGHGIVTYRWDVEKYLLGMPCTD